jgi:outer membrane receptor protein involved in Fe transport
VEADVRLRTAQRAQIDSTRTDASGQFRLSPPANGTFVLTVSRDGFAPKSITAKPDEDLRVVLDLAPVVQQVTVTAESGHAVDVEIVAQPVTVIGRNKIAEQSLVISEAAERELGAHQLRTSPSLGAIFVRGVTGKNVAVYRDGVRYTTSSQRGGISTFLNLVPVTAVEQVEVLRGPNSAQFGSDALGGAVGIVSRTTNVSGGWHGEFGAMAETAALGYGPSLAINNGGPRYGFSANLGAQRFNTLRTGQALDSHAAMTRFLGLPSIGRLPDTAFTSYGGSLHAQLRLSRSSQLIAHYERGQQDGGKRYDQLLGGDGNLIADLRNLMLDFGYLRWQQFDRLGFDQIAFTTSYNAQREERVNQGGQGNPAAAITHQYEKTRANGMQILAEKRWRAADWAAGGDHYWERMVAPSFSVNPRTNAVAIVRPRIPDGARYRHFGAFLQGNLRILRDDRLRLSGAVRYGGAEYNSRARLNFWPDDHLSAHAPTGRIGAVSWLRPWLGVHANFGRGFRVPNVTDLGTLGLQGNGQYEASFAELRGLGALIGDRADDQARSTGLPVERLRPETTNSIDYGVRIRRAQWQADVSGYWMELTNTIVSQTLLLPQGAVGLQLGEQRVARQLPSGAVFVPGSASPVLARANFSGARLRGLEHSFRARFGSRWSAGWNVNAFRAGAGGTGLPPDMEPGVPPMTFSPTLRWTRSRRLWIEAYGTAAWRQARLSSLALSDRRIGNPRSRANIQSYFNNGATARGLVVNGILRPTGETLAQVQNRVLGSANSAPQFSAIPGFAVWGLRSGVQLSERADIVIDATNLFDKNYRGIGWGVDGPGRGLATRFRYRW